MSLLCSYNCAEVKFDVYDSERILVGKSKYKYFVTPSRIKDIEDWMRRRDVLKIETDDHMEELIALGLLGEY